MNRDDRTKILNNDRGHVQVVVRSAVMDDVLHITVVTGWINHNIAQLSPSPFTLTQPALFFPGFTFLLLFQCHSIEASNHEFINSKNPISKVQTHNHIHTKTHSTQSSNFFSLSKISFHLCYTLKQQHQN
jgi:hypothetical protein